MTEIHTGMLRAKPVISDCLFWSKFMKCGSNLFSASTHDLKVYFHPKAKLRVVLGMSLTESCFLVEEYTFFNTHSVFPAFYQQGSSSLSQATVSHPSFAGVTALLCLIFGCSHLKTIPFGGKIFCPMFCFWAAWLCSLDFWEELLQCLSYSRGERVC